MYRIKNEEDAKVTRTTEIGWEKKRWRWNKEARNKINRIEREGGEENQKSKERKKRERKKIKIKRLNEEEENERKEKKRKEKKRKEKKRKEKKRKRKEIKGGGGLKRRLNERRKVYITFISDP